MIKILPGDILKNKITNKIFVVLTPSCTCTYHMYLKNIKTKFKMRISTSDLHEYESHEMCNILYGKDNIK